MNRKEGLHDDGKVLLRISPEKAGISRESLLHCMESWERHQIPMHSFLLLRHGALAVEWYYRPYTPNCLQRFYSITKSLNSLAVGCLVDEGRIKLSDPIIRYFPEYVPDTCSRWLEETTIRDLLMMASCHRATTYKKDYSKNWVESFFKVEADHKPGIIFCYDTSATHTLCALVEKLAGMDMLDYLRVKCLDTIGFSSDSYVLKDPFGTSIGGGGLMARPEDLARVGLLLLNSGRWEGKQLLPEWYVKEAVSSQISTVARAETIDQNQGYGYQFWRIRGGFAAWGKDGQWMACFPEQDMVCVTTADTGRIQAGSQRILDGIYDYILPNLDKIPSKEERRFNPSDYVDPSRLRIRTVAEETTGVVRAFSIMEISGVRWKIREPGWLKEISVELDEKRNQGSWIYVDEMGTHRIEFGFEELKQGKLDKYDAWYAASAAWLDSRTLYLKIDILGVQLGTIIVQIIFSGFECALYMNSTEETDMSEFSGWYSAEARIREG